MRVIPAAVLAVAVATASGSVCSAFSPATFGRVSRPTSAVSLAMAENPHASVFLTPETAKACIETAGGSPLYAYSMEQLGQAADDCLGFPNAFGLTVRYAMKACPNAAILKFFNSKGIHIDASSGYEVSRFL